MIIRLEERILAKGSRRLSLVEWQGKVEEMVRNSGDDPEN